MSKQKKFTWAFSIALIFTLCCFGLSFWSARMAGLQGEYPDNVWEAFTSRAAPASEIREVVDLNFEGLETLTIDAQASDIKILSSKELKGDKLTGPVARFELKGRLPALGSASNTDMKYVSSARNGAEFEVRVADPKAADFRVSLGRFSMGLVLRVYLPEDFKGKIVVRTTAGDVELRGLELKRVLASSASGRIKADKLALDEILAKTQSGDMKLNVRTDTLKAEGMSGDISIRWAPKSQGHAASVEATTMSGDVVIRIPSESSLNVHLKTLSGDLKPNFDGFEIKDEGSSKVAVGKLGRGEGVLRASSLSGDLKLKPFASSRGERDQSSED